MMAVLMLYMTTTVMRLKLKNQFLCARMCKATGLDSFWQLKCSLLLITCAIDQKQEDRRKHEGSYSCACRPI